MIGGESKEDHHLFFCLPIRFGSNVGNERLCLRVGLRHVAPEGTVFCLRGRIVEVKCPWNVRRLEERIRVRGNRRDEDAELDIRDEVAQSGNVVFCMDGAEVHRGGDGDY